MFPEESHVKIYDHDYWWSDAFDGREYARDYDFKKPFFVQFKELLDEVPWYARSIQKMVESDYSNNATGLKNCYLCFNGNTSEDCMYGIAFDGMKSSLDFYQCMAGELCYEIFSVGPGYKNFFCMECGGCRDSWFLLNCQDCSNCFGCVNLRHQQYHIFNVPYSKEEYFKKLAEFNLGSYAALTEIRKKVYELWLRYPRKYMHGVHNSNASGDYVYASKDAEWCYQVVSVEHGKWVQNVANVVKDSYDYTNWGMNSELIYDSITCGQDLQRLKFCVECWPGCQDLEYCVSCHSSMNLFGCVGLKKGEYCILNKQYSRDEYFALREKIMKHMDEMPYIRQSADGKSQIVYRYGEFFPIEFSPFAYTEAAIHDYYPLKKEEAVAQGFIWRDPQPREFEVTMQAKDLPDHIKEVSHAVAKEIIACGLCKRAYRILTQELEFLKRFSIPLPRLCHKCRYLERRKFRNPYKFWHRRCNCAGIKSENDIYTNLSGHLHGNGHCQNEFETSYAPDRPETVYCEQCYQAEVA